nr:MAG TPA: hypothetical protein [Caudoviricetes sp.]
MCYAANQPQNLSTVFVLLFQARCSYPDLFFAPAQ